MLEITPARLPVLLQWCFNTWHLFWHLLMFAMLIVDSMLVLGRAKDSPLTTCWDYPVQAGTGLVDAHSPSKHRIQPPALPQQYSPWFAHQALTRPSEGLEKVLPGETAGGSEGPGSCDPYKTTHFDTTVRCSMVLLTNPKRACPKNSVMLSGHPACAWWSMLCWDMYDLRYWFPKTWERWGKPIMWAPFGFSKWGHPPPRKRVSVFVPSTKTRIHLVVDQRILSLG